MSGQLSLDETKIGGASSQQARRRLTRIAGSRRWIMPLAAVVALTLAALHPFVMGVLPQTADGTLHLYRLVALDHAMADGTLWPRYVAGLTFGYGTPMFNYYSPLSLYPMQVLHVLGLSFLNAWLVGMGLYALVAGMGAFLLGRAWGGVIGGLITSVAYSYAPYTLFDSVWRGTVSEFASLALLPFVLWALWRLATYGHRRDFLATVAVFALFVPMHNVITLHGAALIGLYTLVLWFSSPDKVRALFRLGGALALGMTMTAFFWLPALTETGFVKIDAITANLPEIDVTRNLAPLSDVLRLPMTADPTQMQPPIPIALSWVQIVLAAVGVVLGLVMKVPMRLKALLVMSLLALLLFVFMNTPSSAVLWTSIPLIRYSQFPWRLVGLASLLLALMSGIGVSLLVSVIGARMGKALVVFGTMVAIMIYGIPWLYTIYLPEVDPQDIVDAQDFERESGYIATSSFAEYIPVWSSELPDAARLIDRFEQSEIIPRLEPPEGVTISDARWQNTSADLTFTAEEDITVVFDWFYVPGWQVLVDGEPVNFAPTEPEGLLAVGLPAGTHELSISLQHTDRQSLAVTLSGLSVLVALGVLLIKPMWPRHSAMEEAHEPQSLIHFERGLLRGVMVGAIAIGVGVLAFKIVVIDRIDSPFRVERFAQGVAEGVDQPLETTFGEVVTLIGYDEPIRSVPAGERLLLDVYWRLASVSTSNDYSTVYTLWDDQGNKVAESVNWQPGGLSVSNWLAGDYYIQERVELLVNPLTPPLSYRLTAGVLDPQSGTLLEAKNPNGVIGVLQELGPVDVTFMALPSTINVVDFAENVDVQEIDGFTFIGYNTLPGEATVGQAFTLSWLWQRDENTVEQPETRLVWQPASGEGDAIYSPAIRPVRGVDQQTWPERATLRGLHQMFVPGDLQSGVYDIGLIVGENETPLVMLGSMAIVAPERSFELPEPEFTVDARWENGVQLAGYDLSSETVSLYWQTDTLVFDDLRVFVHFLNENGDIVHQFDGVPAAWTRPVAGWAVDEVITDRYPLANGVPDDAVVMRVGWYDPYTLTRVQVNGGDVVDVTLE